MALIPACFHDPPLGGFVLVYFQVAGDRRPKPGVDLERRARHGQLLDEDGNLHFISAFCCHVKLAVFQISQATSN